jgi:hypothetical protein
LTASDIGKSSRKSGLFGGPETGPKIGDRILGMFSSVVAQIDGPADFGHYGLSAAILPSAAVAERSHQMKY